MSIQRFETGPRMSQVVVNGNTIYRVRVGPMSREEASSLCSKLQGQGGFAAGGGAGNQDRAEMHGNGRQTRTLRTGLSREAASGQ